MLVIGLVLGWLIGWFLGRRKGNELQQQIATIEGDLRKRTDELAACRSSSASLQSDFDARIKTAQADAQARTAELDRVRGEAQSRAQALEASLQDCNAQVVDLQGQLAASAAAGAAAATRSGGIDLGAEIAAAPAGFEQQEADDLTQIHGIGPAFAARLASSGIRRYSDLAAADPQELHKALNIREWQKVDTAEWVAEAGTLARRPRQVQIGDDLTTLEGIGPTYATRLRAAGITTYAQLAATDEATLGEIIGAPAWRRINYGDWIDQARLAAAGDKAGLAALQAELFSRKGGDNLDLIEGLGGTGVKALNDAGITTYADLAAKSPDELRQIFSAAGVRAGNFDSWIAEARLRAAGKRVTRATPTRSQAVRSQVVSERSCPQDLEAVEGIGRIYEQRLYAVGIGTYWELGMIPDDELYSVLEVQEFQDVDLTAIKRDAMLLAAQTNSMGHIWDGSEPDDFDILEGIGPVFERRLYAAGICTYAALAATSEAELAEICQAPAFNRPNYGRWIAQARAELA
jgi:predicted flap endonuclease-1-like 5' DNA nuclease